MKTGLLALLLALGFAAPAWSAVTWATVRNQDCTGLRAATVTVSISGTPTSQATTAAICCTGAGTGFCDDRNTAGKWFSKQVSLVAVGSGAYTVGGDPIPTQALANTQLDTITNWQCEFLTDNAAATPAAGGTIRFPVMVPNGGTPA